mgnify:CR=1 FL=1
MNKTTLPWAPNETFVQSEGHLVSDMDGEKVMLSVQKGKYYNLGEVGGRIWELLASPITLERLVNQLLEQYEVEPELCREQVCSFLGNLLNEGLIRRSPAT